MAVKSLVASRTLVAHNHSVIMHPASEVVPPSAKSAVSHQSQGPVVPTASYAFLSNPPKSKTKHKPQPIATRCIPTRNLPRSNSRRRSVSISSATPFQTTFLIVTPTPTSEAHFQADVSPRTPHLTRHGYSAAFSSSRRSPASPKRSPVLKSAPSSPKRRGSGGSPRRRHHHHHNHPPSPSSSPRRARADSATRVAGHTPASKAAPTLSKIRSLTGLRVLAASPAPSSTSTSTSYAHMATQPKPSSKRSKRSATPARGSPAYAQYRPMPFIQQMQMVQFLEGGTIESHIKRHHASAGQGKAHTGFAIDGQGAVEEVAHGYAFTDERGMIWFDEEEEWEFACLIPKREESGRAGKLRRFLGTSKGRDGADVEEEWERFGGGEEGEEEENAEEEGVDPEALLAREDDDLLAGQDELASFGGDVQARRGPPQSVLKISSAKEKRARRRNRKTPGPAPISTPGTPQHSRNPRMLKEEFLSSSFAPAPAPPSPTSSRSIANTKSSPRTRTKSKPAPPPSSFNSNANANANPPPPRTFSLFKRSNRSTPTVNNDFQPRHAKHPSFSASTTTLRGGSVLDAPDVASPSPSLEVQWAWTEMPRPRTSTNGRPSTSTGTSGRPSASTCVGTEDARMVSMPLPRAAAKRLGIVEGGEESVGGLQRKRFGFGKRG
ncbi:hypothetical protein BU17DRAFT_70384 [Hysterangium stoloniferum]|nr:hypothetical protein BU17DRAFT_70384 [Hysterangium stoloniferum]